MSVCSRSNAIARLIFNKAFVPHLRAKPVFLDSKHTLNRNIIRSVFASRTLYANISFNLTDIGEGIREVVVKEWFVKVGDRVAQFDNICEVQSDKASVTITSRYDGVITKLHYDIDGKALVGQPLVDIETDSAPDTTTVGLQETTLTSENDKPKSQAVDNYTDMLCVPSVRRLAKENNVDLAQIKGSGKGGRILKEDVLKFLETSKAVKKPTEKSIHIEDQGDKVVPITGFKKAMVKTMTEALKIPHFVYCDEISITKVSQIRKDLKEEIESVGMKLTVLPFFIKAVSNALIQYPILNSSVDENCENITFKAAHNIGIAMDTKMGLAVPVIKNVHKLSFLEIVKELNRLLKTGKEGNFTIEDLTGGTFTISNIGNIGGTYTSPIILSPQVAIVAIGASKILPKFDSNKNVIAEEIIHVSGAADHRVVDGATMSHFVTLFKKQLENPHFLLLRT